MKSRLHSYSTWTAAILLVALIVPRCLMASDIAGTEKEIAQQPPCHGMQESVEPTKAFSQLTCAQQCEHSAANSLSVKKYDAVLFDHSLAAIVSNPIQIFSSLTSTTLHQGWPPDNQFLVSSSPNLYLDTGRLRL